MLPRSGIVRGRTSSSAIRHFSAEEDDTPNDGEWELIKSWSPWNIFLLSFSTEITLFFRYEDSGLKINEYCNIFQSARNGYIKNFWYVVGRRLPSWSAGSSKPIVPLALTDPWTEMGENSLAKIFGEIRAFPRVWPSAIFWIMVTVRRHKSRSIFHPWNLRVNASYPMNRTVWNFSLRPLLTLFIQCRKCGAHFFFIESN